MSTFDKKFRQVFPKGEIMRTRFRQEDGRFGKGKVVTMYRTDVWTGWRSEADMRVIVLREQVEQIRRARKENQDEHK